MSSIPFEPTFRKNPFAPINRVFLDDPSLPFARGIPAETVELTFRKYDALFGGTFYNTAVVLWAFLSQVLSDGKQRSCSAAVGRIAAFCLALGQTPPDEDTGNYCRARANLHADALADLVRLVAKNTEMITNDVWLWPSKNQGKRHAKLVDGFTATMPDTLKNQQRFPQHKKQAPGCALYNKYSPIMRVCVVLSLATAMVLDAAFDKYEGKETGESALLRKMLGSFESGDVAERSRS